MDKDLLVTSGQALVKYLDMAGLSPKTAMWVHHTDTNIWRLWIVTERTIDQKEFYRIIAELITRNRNELKNLDISSVEYIDPNHPAIKPLRKFIRVTGFGAASIYNNTFDGFFVADGIVLRNS